jgi:hypothetical protein
VRTGSILQVQSLCKMLGAGVATERTRRMNLERVAGYITRPPVAIKTALAHAPGPHQIFVEDALPRWHDPRDLAPLDFIARLASLVVLRKNGVTHGRTLVSIRDGVRQGWVWIATNVRN